MRRYCLLALLLTACGGGGGGGFFFTGDLAGRGDGGAPMGDLAMGGPRDLAMGGGDLPIGPRCDDGLKNGAETDTDCGGGVCVKCPAGKRCNGNGDCATNLCGGGVCTAPASCNDGQHNGMFTNCVNGDTNRRAQLWKCTPTGAVGSQVCDAGNWTLIDGGGGGTGVLDGYTDFGGAGTGNRTMSMVVANGPFLYVAFDNPTTGIQIWRTSNANPTNEASGWTQLPPSGLTNALGLPDPTNQRYIYSAISVIDGSGTPFLYMATGRNGYPVSIYRFDNN